MPIEPRREHSRVVEHQQILRAEQVGKVAEAVVITFAHLSSHMQQAGGSSVRQGLLGDQLRRKVVIKLGNKHITD
jgi:hypothetical protein